MLADRLHAEEAAYRDYYGVSDGMREVVSKHERDREAKERKDVEGHLAWVTSLEAEYSQQQLAQFEFDQKKKAELRERDSQALAESLSAELQEQVDEHARLTQEFGNAVSGGMTQATEALAAYAFAQDNAAEGSRTLADTAEIAGAMMVKAVTDAIAAEAGARAAKDTLLSIEQFAIGNIPGGLALAGAALGWAALGGTAAAAGGALVSSAQAKPQAAQAAGSGSTAPSSSFGGSGGSSRSGGQAPVTVIFQSPVLASRSEVASDLDALLKQAERRR
jgi:hypothetical protein